MIRRVKRLLESLSSQSNPDTWDEVHGEFAGEMIITLGCTACKFRQSLSLYDPDGPDLKIRPMVPLQAEMHMRFSGPYLNGEVVQGFGLNQKPCQVAPEQCPYGEAIDRIADSLRHDPSVVQRTVDPNKREF